MIDLSRMSDEDLMRAAGVSAPSAPAPPSGDLGHMSDEDLMRAAGVSAPAAPQLTGADKLADFLRSMKKGIYGAPANIAGAPQDIAQAFGKDLGLPTSEKIKEKEKQYLPGGERALSYEPKTGWGRTGETIGEFLPGAALPIGGLGMGARLVEGAVAPAVASQAATELARGTAAEPYAGLASGVAGSLGAARGLGALSRRAAAKAAPAATTAEDLAQKTAQAWNEFDVLPGAFTGSAPADLGAKLRTAASTAGYDPLAHELAPSSTAILRAVGRYEQQGELAPAQLQQLRQLVSRGFESHSAFDRSVAGSMKSALDDFLDQQGQSARAAQAYGRPMATYAGGSAADVGEKLSAANALERRQALSNMLEEAAQKARVSVAEAGGHNIQTVERKALDKILSKRKDLTPDELAAAQRATQGGTSQNVLRNLGRFSAFSGSPMSSIFWALHGVTPLTAGIAGGAHISRGLSNRMQAKNTQQLIDLIRSGGVSQRAAMPSRLAAGSSVPPIAGLLQQGVPAMQQLPRKAPRLLARAGGRRQEED